MIRLISTLICIFLGAILSFSVQAQATDLTKNFGIGLQGATPAYALLNQQLQPVIGGISFRYNGLAPVYLQTVGRFIKSSDLRPPPLGWGYRSANSVESKNVEIAGKMWHTCLVFRWENVTPIAR